MKSNFEYNFDDEIINDDDSESASYIGFPYPIKVSKYDRPHVIELIFPLKRVDYFINRIMLFKLFINKNTTNKEAYNLLLKLSKENSLANKNTTSLFDSMIYNTIKKKMYLYDDDKLLLNKDNSYLDYILSTFISMTIETGVGDFEHNSKVVEKIEKEGNTDLNIILNRKISCLFEEYLDSEEFAIDEINRLKKAKEEKDEYFIEKYIVLAKNLVEFFNN